MSKDIRRTVSRAIVIQISINNQTKVIAWITPSKIS